MRRDHAGQPSQLVIDWDPAQSERRNRNGKSNVRQDPAFLQREVGYMSDLFDQIYRV